jgi:hypothetical protein
MLMTTHSHNGTSARDVPRASARFQRAAAAELAALGQQRDRLMRRRDTVLAELEPIDQAIDEIDRRIELLEHLASETQPVTPSPQKTTTAHAGDRILRGQAIRETAATLLAASTGAAPLHYRRVLEVVQNAGYAIAGADPDAVLLTQLTRSPVIRKAGRPGEYQIDFNAPDRLRARLGVLQADLRQLSDTRIDPSESPRARENRQRIVTELAQNEKALAEAIRCLPATSASQTGASIPPILPSPRRAAPPVRIICSHPGTSIIQERR